MSNKLSEQVTYPEQRLVIQPTAMQSSNPLRLIRLVRAVPPPPGTPVNVVRSTASGASGTRLITVGNAVAGLGGNFETIPANRPSSRQTLLGAVSSVQHQPTTARAANLAALTKLNAVQVATTSQVNEEGAVQVISIKPGVQAQQSIPLFRFTNGNLEFEGGTSVSLVTSGHPVPVSVDQSNQSASQAVTSVQSALNQVIPATFVPSPPDNAGNLWGFNDAAVLADQATPHVVAEGSPTISQEVPFSFVTSSGGVTDYQDSWVIQPAQNSEVSGQAYATSTGTTVEPSTASLTLDCQRIASGVEMVTYDPVGYGNDGQVMSVVCQDQTEAFCNQDYATSSYEMFQNPQQGTNVFPEHQFTAGQPFPPSGSFAGQWNSQETFYPQAWTEGDNWQQHGLAQEQNQPTVDQVSTFQNEHHQPMFDSAGQVSSSDYGFTTNSVVTSFASSEDYGVSSNQFYATTTATENGGYQLDAQQPGFVAEIPLDLEFLGDDYVSTTGGLVQEHQQDVGEVQYASWNSTYDTDSQQQLATSMGSYNCVTNPPDDSSMMDTMKGPGVPLPTKLDDAGSLVNEQAQQEAAPVSYDTVYDMTDTFQGMLPRMSTELMLSSIVQSANPIDGHGELAGSTPPQAHVQDAEIVILEDSTCIGSSSPAAIVAGMSVNTPAEAQDGVGAFDHSAQDIIIASVAGEEVVGEEPSSPVEDIIPLGIPLEKTRKTKIVEPKPKRSMAKTAPNPRAAILAKTTKKPDEGIQVTKKTARTVGSKDVQFLATLVKRDRDWLQTSAGRVATSRISSQRVQKSQVVEAKLTTQTAVSTSMSNVEHRMTVKRTQTSTVTQTTSPNDGPICGPKRRAVGGAAAVAGTGERKRREVLPKPFETFLTSPDGAVIVFDLETCGLEKETEIVEIAACVGVGVENMFQIYSVPQGRITTDASAVNGLSKVGEALRFKGKPVPAVSGPEALEAFVSWLEEHGGRSPLLVAHNCRRFDARVLTFNMYTRADVRVKARFEAMKVRFGDSLPLFRNAFPSSKSHKLADVYRHLFGRLFANAHMASTDVTKLAEILNHSVVRAQDFRKCVFTVQSVLRPLGLVNVTRRGTTST